MLGYLIFLFFIIFFGIGICFAEEKTEGKTILKLAVGVFVFVSVLGILLVVVSIKNDNINKIINVTIKGNGAYEIKYEYIKGNLLTEKSVNCDYISDIRYNPNKKFSKIKCSANLIAYKCELELNTPIYLTLKNIPKSLQGKKLYFSNFDFYNEDTLLFKTDKYYSLYVKTDNPLYKKITIRVSFSEPIGIGFENTNALNIVLEDNVKKTDEQIPYLICSGYEDCTFYKPKKYKYIKILNN